MQDRRRLHELNQRILASARAAGDLRADFLCECGRWGCVERVRAATAAVARAWESGAYVLAPAHERAEGDDVLRRDDAFVSVAR